MNYIPFVPQRPIVVDVLYSVHYFEYASGFKFAGETHKFWELLYVDKGSVQVAAGDEKLELTAGQVIFHEPWEFHALASSRGSAPDLVVIGFSCDSPAMDFFRKRVDLVDNDGRAIMGRIVKESLAAFSTPLNDPTTITLERRDQVPFGSEQRVVGALEELLIQFIRKGEKGAEEKREEIAENDWIATIDEYLRQRLDRPLTLDQICRDNLIGRSQLQKRFHNQTGGGVMAYFAKLKIQAARRLIREGKLNVTQIAARLGYQSVHYFSRSFKQHTGMSPSQYANSVKMLSELPDTKADNSANIV